GEDGFDHSQADVRRRGKYTPFLTVVEDEEVASRPDSPVSRFAQAQKFADRLRALGGRQERREGLAAVMKGRVGLVVMDPFWTATAELAHMVLPACTFLERISLCGIYEGHTVPAVMLRRPAIQPLWESWSDCKFWLTLAKRMGFQQYIPWNTDEEAMDYFLQPSGLTTKYLRDEHPTGIIQGEYGPVSDYHKSGFGTPSGKCELYSENLVQMGIDPLPVFREPPESPVANPELAKEYPLVLTTGVRELEYWHSQQRHVPSLRRRNPEATAQIHPATASRYGITDGDYITIETLRGKARMRAKVTDGIRTDMVATAHGWLGDANENLLTDDTPIDPEHEPDHALSWPVRYCRPVGDDTCSCWCSAPKHLL
ncbi:MAG: molybdopterin-dependent oxidoreductase, partial [Chloroflexi bacterium]|nr:molybdopterin-dependent oxidoreductase [Chloroflexota bacterium]